MTDVITTDSATTSDASPERTRSTSPATAPGAPRKPSKHEALEFAATEKKKRQFRWTEKNREAFAKCQAARKASLEAKKAAKVKPTEIAV